MVKERAIKSIFSEAFRGLEREREREVEPSPFPEYPSRAPVRALHKNTKTSHLGFNQRALSSSVKSVITAPQGDVSGISRT